MKYLILILLFAACQKDNTVKPSPGTPIDTNTVYCSWFITSNQCFVTTSVTVYSSPQSNYPNMGTIDSVKYDKRDSLVIQYTLTSQNGKDWATVFLKNFKVTDTIIYPLVQTHAIAVYKNSYQKKILY